MSVVAAVDIGTNSTRLLVANVSEQGKITVLRTGLKTTRLGENIRERVLMPSAMERTLVAIRNFLEEATGLEARNIILAATSAVRDAVNKQAFLKLIQQKTGHSIRVLSGAEEARLSYLGVVSGLVYDLGQVTVMDVGGGSTEFTWSTSQGVVFKSFNVGAVRMTENNDSYEQIYNNLSDCIKLLFEESLVQGGKPVLVGVGGTVTTMAAIKHKLNIYDPQLVHGSRLDIDDVFDILKLLEERDLEARKQVVGLQPERADIIVAGVRIVHSAMSLLKQEFLTVSESDILHGLALVAADIVETKLD